MQFGADFFFAAFGLGPVEDGFHLRLVVVFEDAEDFVELFERGEQGLRVVLANFAGIEGGVGFAQHVEDGGLRFGGVEVVVEGGLLRRRLCRRRVATWPGSRLRGTCELVRRKRKLRNFSTELAAALRPSKVKFN